MLLTESQLRQIITQYLYEDVKGAIVTKGKQAIKKSAEGEASQGAIADLLGDLNDAGEIISELLKLEDKIEFTEDFVSKLSKTKNMDIVVKSIKSPKFKSSLSTLTKIGESALYQVLSQRLTLAAEIIALLLAIFSIPISFVMTLDNMGTLEGSMKADKKQRRLDRPLSLDDYAEKFSHNQGRLTKTTGINTRDGMIKALALDMLSAK